MLPPVTTPSSVLSNRNEPFQAKSPFKAIDPSAVPPVEVHATAYGKHEPLQAHAPATFLPNTNRSSIMRLVDITQKRAQAVDRKAIDKQAAGSSMTIDLEALRQNYQTGLKQIDLAKVTPSAVLKANGYGLGATDLAEVLYTEGCRNFFVAHFSEAVEVQKALQAIPKKNVPAPKFNTFVLHGPMRGAEAQFVEKGITPVLNTPQQIVDWANQAKKLNKKLPAILQLNTGMNRAGMSDDDVAWLGRMKERGEDPLEHIDIQYLMSHLACASDKDSEENPKQLEKFKEVCTHFPENTRKCFAASSGIFLGPEYHFDMVRMGGILHGEEVIPRGAKDAIGVNPLEQLVTLEAKIQQIRKVTADEGIGYGLTAKSDHTRTIATLGIGFADIFPRNVAGNSSNVYIDIKVGQDMSFVKVPIVGKISMDMTTVDISNVPVALQEDDTLQVLNKIYTFDDLGRNAGTIPAEISSKIQKRVFRELKNTLPEGLKEFRGPQGWENPHRQEPEQLSPAEPTTSLQSTSPLEEIPLEEMSTTQVETRRARQTY